MECRHLDYFGLLFIVDWKVVDFSKQDSKISFERIIVA